MSSTNEGSASYIEKAHGLEIFKNMTETQRASTWKVYKKYLPLYTKGQKELNTYQK